MRENGLFGNPDAALPELPAQKFEKNRTVRSYRALLFSEFDFFKLKKLKLKRGEIQNAGDSYTTVGPLKIGRRDAPIGARAWEIHIVLVVTEQRSGSFTDHRFRDGGAKYFPDQGADR